MRSDNADLTIGLDDVVDVLSAAPATRISDLEQLGVTPECYLWWASFQIRKFASSFDDILPLAENQAQKQKHFIAIWRAFAHKLKSGFASLDAVAEELSQSGIIATSLTAQQQKHAVRLLHSILGVQTMLFAAKAIEPDSDYLSIFDELHGFEGLAIMATTQDFYSVRSSLNHYLLRFGMMLPPENFVLHDNLKEETSPVQRPTELDPISFNAGILNAIGRVTFKWTDSLACHLEFDEKRREMYLFRYPSYCMYCWSSNPADLTTRSAIHGCARNDKDFCDWATAQEVSQLLKEIIWSYRILFGQTRSSRRFYIREMDPWAGTPSEGRDNLLELLCSERKVDRRIGCPDKEFYSLEKDFPMLSGKLSQIAAFLGDCRPRTISELWKDKRDNSSWLTLWVVLIIGVLALFLAFVQVVLQIIQLILR